MVTPEEIEALRVATREAHEVLKDLRSALKEANRTIPEIEAAAQVTVNERMEPVVEKNMEEFSKALNIAIVKSTDAVFARFDKISELLLGEDKASKRQGKPSVPTLIQKKVNHDNAQ